jgi:transcriptional regulator with XRE-family HTH domain
VRASHRRIAELVGQSQPEVSEIINDRQVMGYDVLVRICEGLGIPRGLMGLAYDEDSTPPDPVEEVDEEMKRRALLAAGSVALFGAPLLGQVLHIPVRPETPTPLPSRLVSSDVTAIRSLTAELRRVARVYGGCAERSARWRIGHVF